MTVKPKSFLLNTCYLLKLKYRHIGILSKYIWEVKEETILKRISLKLVRMNQKSEDTRDQTEHEDYLIFSFYFGEIKIQASDFPKIT